MINHKLLNVLVFLITRHLEAESHKAFPMRKKVFSIYSTCVQISISYRSNSILSLELQYIFREECSCGVLFNLLLLFQGKKILPRENLRNAVTFYQIKQGIHSITNSSTSAAEQLQPPEVFYKKSIHKNSMCVCLFPSTVEASPD